MNNTQTFLPPIEKPKGFIMKLAYYVTKKQYGKVMTPLKVMWARLPIAFGKMAAKTVQLDKKMALSKGLASLIRYQVARINICEFCMDIGKYDAMKELMNEEKFNGIGDYQSSSLYSVAEKCALDYATELTRERRVDPQTFSKMAKHYSDREICEIAYLVASEHFLNISNIGLNIHSDMFCDINKKKV